MARFNGTIKKLIHALKYADRHEGLSLYGRWMAKAGEELLKDADLVLPVPLSRKRLWTRRFNQAALLAHAVSRYCNKPIDCLSLTRVKDTKTQVGLTRKQRQKNVSTAFHIPESRKQRVSGRNVLLLDDVFTTGATINACTKALLKSGAASVDVLTLARVVEPTLLDNR